LQRQMRLFWLEMRGLWEFHKFFQKWWSKLGLNVALISRVISKRSFKEL